MRVSLRWLAEYTELPEASPEALAERLTLAGLEVEGLRELSAEGVRVGRVLAVEPHPHADDLRVCLVQVGNEEYRTVCGAPNVAPGLLVPFALPGARLPRGPVGETTVRGVRSAGMILSREELGLEEKSTGIWELPPGTPPGADLAELLELPDLLLDLKITSNRPDLLGMYGLAREFSALFRTRLRELALDFPEGERSAAELADVQVESGEDCPRYVARVIQGVAWRPAPLRLQARLLKAGLRPIALAVDLTNYVMLEVGHPLHAFDRARLRGGRIVVRRARPGEALRTLDGVERALAPEILVIADAEQPVALAGIMGGEGSEVEPDTREVLLEAAAFAPARIRRGARLLGLRTEASLRFERGLSPENVDLASRRFCALWVREGGGTVARGAVDVYLKRPARRAVPLRRARIPGFLGIHVPDAEVVDGLTRLGVALRPTESGWEAEIPPHRGDLAREEDLLEEIARLYGYDRIPELAPAQPARVGGKAPEEEFADRVRRILAGLGLLEAYTFPLVSAGEAQVLLKNPMAQGQEGLRDSLFPGLLAAVRENLSAQAPGGALFEVGKVFLLEDGVPREEYRVGLVLFGRTDLPLCGKAAYGPAELKGVVEALLAALRVEGWCLGPCADPRLHPFRRAALLVQGQPAGLLGEVNPELLDLPGARRVLFAELRLPVLQAHARPAAYRPLPRFPASKRDLSLLAPETLPEEEIRARILAEPLVESAFLYDRYQGPGIPAGQVSLTYELSFRDPQRTLSAEEVEGAVGRILSALAELGVRLRT
ncbi:MAG: phenylalanine--tRNA ligase subunit beta [Candidatus Bipolaricaulota bacterium]|nr:phenylalanine--tRNA ligase subunit beta [Candidatus Bipolaricaulota bacterium]MDW8151734.1 phenylalanine--tRNA ligase subunit beta [Candidatus Bipolaricaulota bacterium]